ncbi:unnamed protein product [Discosporangium mesarthrocarpum]
MGGFRGMASDSRVRSDPRAHNLNDVWKSRDGKAWVRLLERSPWIGRDGHAALVHNGAIYLMGGTQDPRSTLNDVWRSVDGRAWVQWANSSSTSSRNSNNSSSESYRCPRHASMEYAKVVGPLFLLAISP